MAVVTQGSADTQPSHYPVSWTVRTLTASSSCCPPPVSQYVLIIIVTLYKFGLSVCQMYAGQKRGWSIFIVITRFKIPMQGEVWLCEPEKREQVGGGVCPAGQLAGRGQSCAAGPHPACHCIIHHSCGGPQIALLPASRAISLAHHGVRPACIARPGPATCLH